MTTPLHDAPLHDQNPTTRFADRAKDYVKFRPTYPTVAIDAVLAGLQTPTELIAADIGAGTGISSRLLADRGVRVMAVEPNRPMAEAAERHAGVTFVQGTAEATTLSASSVGLVLCAQAFHWFRPVEALAEFRRILARGGRLALVWNIRDESDPLTSAYSGAIRSAIGAEPAEMREFHPGVIEHAGFAGATLQVFPHTQSLDLEGFVGRATSASYVPKAGPIHDALIAELGRVHARHVDAQGVVTMLYQTRVYLSQAP